MREPFIKLYHEDCLEGMKRVEDKSIDLILTDLPYGITNCKWDSVIPFQPLWEQYERVIKDNGAIVLTATQPFTSALVMSNPKLFKYALVWDKVAVTNPLLAKKQFMRSHEDVLIFYKKQPTYNPQKYSGKKWHRGGKKEHSTGSLGALALVNSGSDKTDLKLPKSILTFSNANKTQNIHPTQKPVALMEYLIKTYTNEYDTVLDSCFGSGTTGVAAKNLNRSFIGFEKEEKYFNIAYQRIHGEERREEVRPQKKPLQTVLPFY